MNLRYRGSQHGVLIALAVTGSLLCLAGCFIALFSMTIPAYRPGSVNLLHGAIYVGTNTCYTCHSDTPDWSPALYAETIVSQVKNPAAVTDAQLDAGVQLMNFKPVAAAFTTGNLAAPANNTYHWHYIIRTEDGSTVHPDRWHTLPFDVESAVPATPSTQCGSCHLSEMIPGYISIAAVDLAVRSDSRTRGLQAYDPDKSGEAFNGEAIVD